MQALGKPDMQEALQAELLKLRPGSRVLLCRTLEVSVKATKAALEQVRRSVEEERARVSGDVHVLYLHFGVHEGATGFNLERKAFNEADFALDVQGYSADHEPINAKQGVEFHYTSNLPLEALALAASAAGYPCEVSNDAGRYLCNYVYFSSLMKCARKDEDALFVHVPPVRCIAIEKQLEFAKFLIKELVRQEWAKV